MNTIITGPIRKRMILVFDVETTGLLPKKNKESSLPIPIESYPYILQLSCVLFDIFEQRIVKIYDSYIDIPDNIQISKEVTELTGIDKNICKTKGKNIIDVMSDFYDIYMLAEVIVAHNIDFDEQMIQIEVQRNRKDVLDKIPFCFTIFSKIYEKLKGIERYCTMKNGTEICSIVVEGKKQKKWPRLSELHKTLFDEVPDGLHNSMIDVLSCLRCYLKMRHGIRNLNPLIL
jgi:DNA polymerase-3 subunit epsilon